MRRIGDDNVRSIMVGVSPVLGGGRLRANSLGVDQAAGFANRKRAPASASIA